MAAPDTSFSGLTETTRAEHNSDAKSKKILVRGQDPSDGEFYNATVRSVGSNPSLNVAIVDSAGNHVTSFGGSGGTSATDDAAFTAASGSGTPIMGFVTSDSVDSGDVGVLGMDTARNLKVSIEADNVGIGGGIQYTEGDTDASITGTALLFEGAADTLVTAPGTAANGLDVDVTRVSGTVTVDGSGVTQPVSNSGLTELAAAIGGTNPSQLDVYVKGSDVATGGTSTADDADFTAGTTAGTIAQGVYESTPTTVTDGDVGAVGITTDRRLKTSSTIDAALPAGTNNIGDVDVLSSALPTGAATAANQQTDALTDTELRATPVSVDLGANNDVTVTSGTVTANLGAVDNAVLDQIELNQDSQTAILTTIDTDTGTIAGTVSGSEMQVDVVGALPAGTNAIGKLSANSGVDIGDVTVNNATTAPVFNFPADYEFAGVTTHVKKYYTNAGAVTDGIIWSPAAGKRWYVTDIFINVSAAATVTLEDDLAAGDSAVWKAELAANSGWSHSFNTPLFSGEDAADLLITTSAGNCYVCVTGYEI